MRRKWDLLCVVLLLFIGVWGIAGLWKVSGLPTSHDSISHLTRMYAYLEGLRDGQFPVLWAKRMFWGIGSPVLMLNYQVPYYFSMFWHSLGLSLDDSFKAVLSFSHLTSGILMYWALRIRYRHLPSLVGALLYIVAPYRFLNIYVRGAMGEVFAVMFPPIILAGMWKQSSVLQTVGWSGLFLSHPVGSALYSGVFLGYTLLADRFRNIFLTLKQFFLPYALAFMIASFNLLPTLALTSYTYYKTENSNTLENFPTLRQLVYSPWGYGFSTSDARDEMSFQIGVIQWFLAVLAIFVLFNYRKSMGSVWELAYLVGVFGLAIVLMVEETATPIYVHLWLSKIIDYPWRLLMLFTFLSALLGARIVSLINQRYWKIGLSLFIILGALFTNRNHIRINEIWPWPSESFIPATGDAFGEYAAKYRSTRDGSQFSQIAEFTKGSGQIEVTQNTSHRTHIIVRSKEPTTVRLNTMYFPGWRVEIDGDIVPIDDTQSRSSLSKRCYVTVRRERNIDDSGLIACQVFPGVTNLDLSYHAVPIQKTGYLLTLSGLGILIWLTFRSYSPHLMNVMRSWRMPRTSRKS
jgi:hypothetical protein